jgi:putative sugar O-methyltransferase|tara:strand:- start:7517 stop:8671 length:1155 start_codon:yes stop_codon:yes gene_type:complete
MYNAPVKEVTFEELEFINALGNTETSPNRFYKSEMWKAPNKDFLENAKSRDVIKIIQSVQKTGLIYLANDLFNVKSKHFGLLVEFYLQYIKDRGFNLDDFDKNIAESAFAPLGQTLEINGRLISIDFLVRFGICIDTLETITQQNVNVLDIGAGLGSLIRVVKLINPSARCTIIDIPGTLAMSYANLRKSFPESKFQVVTTVESVSEIDTSADFTFVPAFLASDFEDFSFDIVYNTGSMAEMSQSVVESYINLIQNKLDVKQFYSVNRYLEPDDKNKTDKYQATWAVFLDSYWDISKWEYQPDLWKFHWIWDAHMAASYLKIHAERIPKSELPDELRIKRSEELFEGAKSLEPVKGHKWHRCIHEVIRYDQRLDNVKYLYEFCK